MLREGLQAGPYLRAPSHAWPSIAGECIGCQGDSPVDRDKKLTCLLLLPPFYRRIILPSTLLLALAFGGQGHAGATRIPGPTYGSAEGGVVLLAARNGTRQVASIKWRWRRRRAESGAVLICIDINRLIGAGRVVPVHGAGCTRHGFVRVTKRRRSIAFLKFANHMVPRCADQFSPTRSYATAHRTHSYSRQNRGLAVASRRVVLGKIIRL